MFLEIINKDSLDLDKFIKWLMQDIAINAVKEENRDEALESAWQNYFNESDFGWARDSSDAPVVPSVTFIITQYFENLHAVKTDTSYIINVDPNLRLRGTDIPIDLLATLMNNGTLTEPPYPYFDFIFEAYSNNVQFLYEQWLNSNGKLAHEEDNEYGVEEEEDGG